MAAPRHNANGHRRREVVKRVLAEEHSCRLCDLPVDKTLGNMPGVHSKKCPGGVCLGCIPDPRRAEVDELVPRSRGGSPYDRKNTGLMHRACNAFKSDMPLEEARARWNKQWKPIKIRPSAMW